MPLPFRLSVVSVLCLGLSCQRTTQRRPGDGGAVDPADSHGPAEPAVPPGPELQGLACGDPHESPGSEDDGVLRILGVRASRVEFVGSMGDGEGNLHGRALEFEVQFNRPVRVGGLSEVLHVGEHQLVVMHARSEACYRYYLFGVEPEEIAEGSGYWSSWGRHAGPPQRPPDLAFRGFGAGVVTRPGEYVDPAQGWAQLDGGTYDGVEWALEGRAYEVRLEIGDQPPIEMRRMGDCMEAAAPLLYERTCFPERLVKRLVDADPKYRRKKGR